MAENNATHPSKIKIQRTRKRLYEAGKPETPADSVVEPRRGETPADSVPVPHPDETSSSVFRLDETPSSVFRLDETPLALKQERYAKSRRLVDYHAAFAGTAGFIPMPVIDMLLVSAVQLKLIRDLSRLYDVSFSRQRAKAIIAALLGGLQTGLISSSAGKYIPAIGALATIPTALGAGATTYAVGRVFIYHFELGGTLLDFNADQLREYFRRQLNQKPQSTIKAGNGSDKV